MASLDSLPEELLEKICVFLTREYDLQEFVGAYPRAATAAKNARECRVRVISDISIINFARTPKNYAPSGYMYSSSRTWLLSPEPGWALSPELGWAPSPVRYEPSGVGNISGGREHREFMAREREREQNASGFFNRYLPAIFFAGAEE